MFFIPARRSLPAATWRGLLAITRYAPCNIDLLRAAATTQATPLRHLLLKNKPVACSFGCLCKSVKIFLPQDHWLSDLCSTWVVYVSEPLDLRAPFADIRYRVPREPAFSAVT